MSPRNRGKVPVAGRVRGRWRAEPIWKCTSNATTIPKTGQQARKISIRSSGRVTDDLSLVRRRYRSGIMPIQIKKDEKLFGICFEIIDGTPGPNERG